MTETARTGGEALIEALKIHGTTHAFCVPGESYLAALDALYGARDEIQLITCRQEGGAANMAEAYGKLTGKPGICFVTRGPGATNACIGVHTAFQDSTPMILFIGQADQSMLDREAFQEVDFRAMFAPLAKWAAEIRDANRIPEYVARAFHVATSGRPGPVVLSLPEDVLSGMCTLPAARPYKKSEAFASQGEIANVTAMLTHAERPLVVLGGPGWDHHAIANAKNFAERWNLPVVTSFRAKDRFDNRHPNYCGDMGIGADPKLVKRIEDSDLLIVVGARLGEMTTNGYTRLSVPVPKQTLIHVHPSADELNRVYQADRAIVSGVAPFLEAMAALPAPDHQRWRAWRENAARGLRSLGQAGFGARRAQSVGHLCLAERDARGRCHPDQWRGQLRGLAASLLSLSRLSHLARPDLRRHGLWPAGGGRRQDRPPGAHRRLRGGRRRLPDERAGAGDRRAI